MASVGCHSGPAKSKSNRAPAAPGIRDRLVIPFGGSACESIARSPSPDCMNARGSWWDCANSELCAYAGKSSRGSYHFKYLPQLKEKNKEYLRKVRGISDYSDKKHLTIKVSSGQKPQWKTRLPQ